MLLIRQLTTSLSPPFIVFRHCVDSGGCRERKKHGSHAILLGHYYRKLKESNRAHSIVSRFIDLFIDLSGMGPEDNEGKAHNCPATRKCRAPISSIFLLT